MRADRLLRLILVLGDGRRRTAATLAESLEVSERTILRDVEALLEAGIPVDAQRGPDGGIALPRAWARYAAGLTGAEVEAIATLAAPTAEVALGKVLAALPAAQRAQAEAAQRRLLIDPTPWWSEDRPLESLEVLREAVATEREVRLDYHGTTRTIRPLGLVVKADRWYVLAETDGGRRTFRGDRITSAALTDARFVRDPGFDLRAAWAEAKASFVTSRACYRVTLCLTDEGRRRLAAERPAAERDAIAREPAVIDFEREEIALGTLVLLGAEAQVLAPSALIARMAAVAAAWSRGAERERTAQVLLGSEFGAG